MTSADQGTDAHHIHSQGKGDSWTAFKFSLIENIDMLPLLYPNSKKAGIVQNGDKNKKTNKY